MTDAQTIDNANGLEAMIAGLAAGARDHCDACRWAYAETGLNGRPFEEAFIHRAVRAMEEGDIVRSFRPIDGLGRHALGRVLHMEQVPEGRRWVAITKWEDEDEVRHVFGVGATGMLVMRRDGETVGRPGHEFAVARLNSPVPAGLA